MKRKVAPWSAFGPHPAAVPVDDTVHGGQPDASAREFRLGVEPLEGAEQAAPPCACLKPAPRDGREVLKAVRENLALAGTPVAVLTSSFAPRDREEAMRLGADRYIHKPSDLHGFLQAVGNIVNELLSLGPGGGEPGPQDRNVSSTMGMSNPVNPPLVLIVDDDAQFASSLGTILEGHGYRAMYAQTERQAVSVLDSLREQINLVIVDLVLHNESGFQLIGALRRRPNRIKIIAVSGVSANPSCTLPIVSARTPLFENLPEGPWSHARNGCRPPP